MREPDPKIKELTDTLYREIIEILAEYKENNKHIDHSEAKRIVISALTGAYVSVLLLFVQSFAELMGILEATKLDIYKNQDEILQIRKELEEKLANLVVGEGS